MKPDKIFGEGRVVITNCETGCFAQSKKFLFWVIGASKHFTPKCHILASLIKPDHILESYAKHVYHVHRLSVELPCSDCL